MTDMVYRLSAYLTDRPADGGHSDRAGGNCWELLDEAHDEIVSLRKEFTDMETALNSSGAARALAQAELERLRVDAGELVVTQYQLAAAKTALREIDATPYMVTNDSESLRHTIKSIQHTARTALRNLEKN
jgi:hypothetical protein